MIPATKETFGAAQAGQDGNAQRDPFGPGAPGLRGELPLKAEPIWMDVWSRSGSRYRIRAILLLTLNVLLFSGVGIFAFWLRSGEFFAPAREGYASQLWHTLLGVGEAEVSLGSLLIGPISVQDVPVLIPILGLLMAALVSMPILVAILYRFWSSLPFIAVVGFLAVMPWLAITLLGSCTLASVRPFRTRFRFMSALIALVPVIVYLALAWNGTREVMVGLVDPADAFKFVAPWVLAIVASAAVFAIVLSLARLVNYRPGAVTPLLAVMFALPVATFEERVGRDELYYRLLEKLDAFWFADVDASSSRLDPEEGAWPGFPMPPSSMRALQDRSREKWLLQIVADVGPYATELTQHQLQIADRCDQFLRYFPDSRYALNALYIKAKALDQRIDMVEFQRSRWVRFYDGFPSDWSTSTWRILWANRPYGRMGAVAGLRLSQLEARDREMHQATRRLKEVLDRFEPEGQAEANAGPSPFGGEALRAQPPPPGDSVTEEEQRQAAAAEASLRIPLDQILLEVRRLHDLLVLNNDPRFAHVPLHGPKRASAPVWYGLLDVNPRGGHFPEQAAQLVTLYQGCEIEDNVELEIALLARDLKERITRLTALLERFPTRDAAPEAMFHLAKAFEAAGRPAEALHMFTALGRAHPDSFWAKAAPRLSKWGASIVNGRLGPESLGDERPIAEAPGGI